MAAHSQLLDQCRDVARVRLGEVVAGALARIDEDLFALADKSEQREAQAIYLDAMTRVREHRSDIQSRFEQCFGDLYQQKLSAAAQKPETSSFGGIELSLVSHSKIEHNISIQRMAKSVSKGTDGNEMLGIRARLGHLMHRDSLDDADNPLGPELIFEALRLACNHIPAGNPVKQAMLAAFQPYLRASINEVYHAVNETLLAHHVLPQIRHSVKTSADPLGATGRHAGLGQTGRNAGLGQTGRNAGLNQSQQMGTLGQSQRMGLLNSGRVDQPQGGVQRSGWLGGSVGNEAAGLGAILAGLRQGQSAARVEALSLFSDAARFPTGAGAVEASAALLQTLAQLQSAANLGDNAAAVAPGYLHQASQALTENSTLLDRLTVELVSMVFDFLFATPRLPEAVKSVISRLQIVAVKAALLDRSFFARRDHPMRRLLDRMAEAGADPLIECEADSPVISAMRRIADDLCVRFTDDCAIFDAAIASLETAIGEEEQRHSAATDEPAIQLAATEAANTAIAAARADMDARVRSSTPKFIREFLTQWWVNAIAHADLSNAQGDDSVTLRLGVASDLVWSVEPKKPADVAVLAALLPGMMQGLARGLRRLQLPEAQRKVFFDSLMQAHTVAVASAKNAPAGTVFIERPSVAEAVRRAGLPPLTAVVYAAPPLAMATGVSNTAAAEAANAAAGGFPVLNLDDAPVAASESAAPPAPESWERAVAALVKGSLVEFADGQDTERCRLAWISPRRSFYLFMAHGKMRQLAAGQLSGLFQQGMARLAPVEQPLVDQALASMAMAEPERQAA